MRQTITAIGRWAGLMILFMASISSLCAQPGVEEGEATDTLLHKADSLYEAFQNEQALQQYQKVLAEDSSNYTALWRGSLLHSRIGFNRGSDENLETHYNRALKLAEKALTACTNCVESHFVMGVALGRKALLASPRERISLSKKIKDHAEKALRADSSHAGAQHLLGRWHLEVTNLNFAERMAAKWLFGGLPGVGSIEKAIFHLKRSTQIQPALVIYWFDLGRAYHSNGETSAALDALETAIKLEPQLDSGEKYKKQAKDLYHDLK